MVLKKHEDLVKNIKRNQMTKYVSPGIYVKEVDISTYFPKSYPPKKRKKIAKIFSK
jgi:hypothetical protein